MIAMLNVWLATEPSLLAASTVIERVAPCSFAIDRGRRSDDTPVGIDVEQSVGIAGQTVGNGVVGRVQVERIGGNAHRRADANVLRDFIGRGIAVGGHGDVEFVHVDDGDVEGLAGN